MRERIPTANEMYFGSTPADRRYLEAREKTFFRSVGLPNGTWKTTSYRRLDDLNWLVERYLPAHRPLDVMDVAVSSAVSTVEWLESLERAGIQCRLTAGDAAVNAFLLSMFGGWLRALVDSRGHVLQYEIGGRGFEVPLRRRYIPQYFLPVLLMKAMGRALAPTLRASTATGSRWGVTWRPLQLVSPSVRGRIEVVEDDILVNRSYQRCFHVVRAANILNRGYFDDATLTAMVTNLRERLRAGGVLVVCRTTDEGVNHGTVFALAANGRLQVLARLNDGSEIEQLALGLPARA